MNTSELPVKDERKDLLRFVSAGSVDDGKSTLIGRLLFESKGIYEDQLDAIRRASGRSAISRGQLDLSLVTDGLKAEREQGITIDVAYRYFSTPRRKFIIADTPGHEQYTRNMATGASTANLAIILVDAVRGLTTQSRRHAFLASLLGIGHLVIAVNKMDLVGYSREVFERIRDEFESFAARLATADMVYIPISALAGDNIVQHSGSMPWYQGSTLLNHLETVHVASDCNLIDLRLPVQYVCRSADGMRCYMGTLGSGIIRPGDEVIVLPRATRTRVQAVCGPDGELDEAFAPMAVGVVLADQIDVSRGDMIVHVHNVPRIGQAFDAMLVWMGGEPMQPGPRYLLKHASNTVAAAIETLRYRIDVNTMHRCQSASLGTNEIGRVAITTARPIAYDPYRINRATGPFVLIDRLTNQTVAAGTIVDREPEPGSPAAAVPFDSLADTLGNLERRLAGSEEASELLADEFVAIGSDGATLGRADWLATVSDRPGTISDLNVRMLSAQIAVVSYRAVDRTAGRSCACCSMWKLLPSGWRIVFHQATPVM